MTAQAGSSEGLIGRVARGTAWSVAGAAVGVAASLIVTPLTIRLFGPDKYGLWILLNVTVAWLASADFGMSPTSTKFASEAYARQDAAAESGAVWTAAILGIVPTATVGAAFIWAAPMIAALLRVPVESSSGFILALRIGTIITSARILSGLFNTPELVRLKMGLYNGINTAGNLLQICLVPVAIWAGFGLAGAAAAAGAAACLTTAGHLAACFLILPEARKFRFCRPLAVPMLEYGIPLAVLFYLELVMVNSEKFFLAWAATPRALAYYGVAFSFANFLATPSLALSQALLPAFGRLVAAGDSDALCSFYSRTIKGLLLGLAPAMFAMGVFCRPFLSVWAGAEYGVHSPVPAYVLIAGLAVESFGYIPARLLFARGQTRLVAYCYAAQMPPYIGLLLWMTRTFGPVGAAAAWAIRASVNAGIMSWWARRAMPVSVSPFKAGSGWVGASVLVLLVPFAACLSLEAPGFLPRILVAAPSLMGYAVIVWFKVLTSQERGWSASQFRAVLGAS